MIASIAWKEYREHRAFWVVLVGLTVLVLAGMSQFVGTGSPWGQGNDPAILTAIGAFVMTGMYGLVCGGMMIAGERESRAIPFLDNLPASRAELWWAKLFVGTVLTGSHALVTVGIMSWLELPKQAQLPPWWALALGGVAIESFSWGFCTSAICRNVLSAIALAALLPLVGVWLVCTGLTFMVPPLLIGVRLLLILMALSMSLSFFTNREWEKRFSLAIASSRGEAAPKRAPVAWEAILWVAFRQGRVEILAIFGVAIVLGLFLPASLLLFWLLGTLIIGSVAGAAVFSGEQAERSNRLFGDQRFPVGQIWTWKSGLSIVMALLATGLMALVAAVRSVADPEGGTATELQFLVDTLVGGEPGPSQMTALTALALTGLFSGFAFGQFSCLAWRKSSVSVVVAVMGAAGAVSLWTPSLIAGGTSPWQLLVLPMVVLLACRLSQWAWVADRLHSRRPMMELIAGVVLGIVWAGGVFAYRAQEPPVGTEPFDVAAFQTTLTQAAGEQAANPLARAMKAMNEAIQADPVPNGPPGRPVGDGPQDRWNPGMEAERVGRNFEQERRERMLLGVLEHGWQDDLETLTRWLERVSREDWARQFRDATEQPPARLFDPRLGYRTTPELDSYRLAANIMTARALQCQHFGKPAEGLDLLATVLALARHLQYMAPPRVYQEALEIEAVALTGLGHWLGAKPLSRDLLKQALEALSKHESERQDVLNTIKIDYLNILRGFEDPAAFPDARANPWARRMDSESLGVVVVTPWERARARRLANGIYAGRLRAAETAFAPALVTKQGMTAQEGLMGDWVATPSMPADTGERLGDLLADSWLRHYLPRTEDLQRTSLVALCKVRAMRIVTGLRLFESERGRPANSLDELAVQTLVEVPIDPLGYQPFGYRLSEGEKVLWPRSDNLGGRFPREIAAGQGILWSVGPDGVNHGGLKQWDREDTEKSEADLLFVVPRPRKE